MRALRDTETRVDIVVPVYNEARTLAGSVRALVGFLSRMCLDDWRVVIADNGSTDETASVMEDLASRDPRVRALRIPERGRGRALKAAWGSSQAEVHVYMDVDLSTELPAVLLLLERVRQGYDIAIGSRHLPEAVVTRGLKRDVLSRGYNALLRAVFGTPLTDAQCGFKAVSHRVVTDLLPFVQSNGWFFDTELLLLAERLGYRIAEVPVRWVEDRDSRVRIVPTIWEYLGEVWRLRRSAWRSLPPAVRPPIPAEEPFRARREEAGVSTTGRRRAARP
jgi:glycosyltransferase involved in cell wall biosynthesis